MDKEAWGLGLGLGLGVALVPYSRGLSAVAAPGQTRTFGAFGPAATGLNRRSTAALVNMLGGR